MGAASSPGVARSAAAVVALATLPGTTLPCEMPPAGERFVPDLVSPTVRSHDGVVAVPLTQPGLGHEVDQRTVDTLTVRSASVGSLA